MLRALDRAVAGKGFDAPYARRDSAFGKDAKISDIARASHMGTAAQFSGKLSELQHTDLVIVFLAEQRDGARFDGLVVFHLAHTGRHVGTNACVDDALDLGKLLAGRRFEMGKVES